MYPHERSLVKQLSDKPFVIVGVNSDRNLDKIQGVVKEKNITWRSFWNGPEGTIGPIAKRWGVTSWPTIFVLDAKGVIRFKDVRGNNLDKALETLLAELDHNVTISHEEEELDEKDGEPNSK